MATVPDAVTDINRPDECLHDQSCCAVHGQVRRSWLRIPHLSYLIKSRSVNRFPYHRIQFKQTIEISRLRQKIICPQQLSALIRTQPQRPTQRETSQSQVCRAETCSPGSSSKDYPATFHGDEVRYRRIQLRITTRAIRAFRQIVIYRANLRAPRRHLDAVLPQILKLNDLSPTALYETPAQIGTPILSFCRTIGSPLRRATRPSS